MPKRGVTLEARRYLLAVLTAVAALLLRMMFAPLLGTDNPYLTAWAAIVVSAWYFGIGPTIVCTLGSILGVWYFFIPPFRSFALQNPMPAISGMLLFLGLSGFIIALGEANRRSKARAEREASERWRMEEELRKAQADLEQRVDERTAELNVVNQKLSQEAARVRAQAEWLDAANDAIFVASADSRITYWNKGSQRLYGWAMEEAVGRSQHELLRTEFPIPFAEISRQRRQSGWQGELVHTRQDGTKVTVASRWTPLRDANNNLAGWLEINRDVTDRKAAESARQLSAQLMKMQDEEHQRIARELHDSTGQMVVALMLNLGRLKASGSLSPEDLQLLCDSDALLQNINS